jgi:hypothetical protein
MSDECAHCGTNPSSEFHVSCFRPSPLRRVATAQASSGLSHDSEVPGLDFERYGTFWTRIQRLPRFAPIREICVPGFRRGLRRELREFSRIHSDTIFRRFAQGVASTRLAAGLGGPNPTPVMLNQAQSSRVNSRPRRSPEVGSGQWLPCQWSTRRALFRGLRQTTAPHMSASQASSNRVRPNQAKSGGEL